jgi:hypothetical protein
VEVVLPAWKKENMLGGLCAPAADTPSTPPGIAALSSARLGSRMT